MSYGANSCKTFFQVVNVKIILTHHNTVRWPSLCRCGNTAMMVALSWITTCLYRSLSPTQMSRQCLRISGKASGGGFSSIALAVGPDFMYPSMSPMWLEFLIVCRYISRFHAQISTLNISRDRVGVQLRVEPRVGGWSQWWSLINLSASRTIFTRAVLKGRFTAIRNIPCCCHRQNFKTENI